MNSDKRFGVYRQLLQLYPRDYHERYAEPMLQTLADMIDHAPNGRSRHRIWRQAALDLPFDIVRQHALIMENTLMNDTPAYVRRNSLIAGLLLVPFVLAVLAQSLGKLVFNNDLYHSWLWNSPVLFTWVLLLPGLTFVISLVTLVTWTIERHRNNVSVWRSLFDLRHSWPMLITVLAGLFIVALVFGHDSVHCVTGNPFHEIQHWNGTWSCIRQR